MGRRRLRRLVYTVYSTNGFPTSCIGARVIIITYQNFPNVNITRRLMRTRYSKFDTRLRRDRKLARGALGSRRDALGAFRRRQFVLSVFRDSRRSLGRLVEAVGRMRRRQLHRRGSFAAYRWLFGVRFVLLFGGRVGVYHQRIQQYILHEKTTIRSFDF